MSLRNTRLIVPIALALGSPAVVAAPEVQADGGKSTSQTALLEEVMVTAQKREERLLSVPISISAVAGEVLDASSSVGVTDALTQVPGVTAQVGVQGGGTQIGIRGVSAAGAQGNGSSPIGYYLDSVPFGFVKTAFTPDPNAYDLKRIEVLRGPQGTLYGAGGENGLVRVLTSDADTHEFGLKGRATLSSTDGGGTNYRGDMAINVPVIQDKLAIRGVLGYGSMDGWIDSPNAKDINDARLQTYRLKLEATPSDNLSIGLSAWSNRNDYDAPSVADENRSTKATAAQPIEDDFDAYGATVGYDFSSFSLLSMTSYIDYDNLGRLDLTSLGVPGLMLETGFGSTVLSEELLLTSALENSPWRWSAGLFYREADDKLTSQFLLPGTFQTVYLDHSNSWAVFGEISRKFLEDQMEWTLGVRYFKDDVSTDGNYTTSPDRVYHAADSFDAVTPRAVLTWHPSTSVTVYGSYSEGFRSGFPQGAAVAQLQPDFPSVKPDKLHNFEVGAKGDFLDGKLSLDASLYYMRWNDVQLTLVIPYINNATITAPVNGDSASGPGVDFSLTLRPIDALTLGASLSLNQLQLDKDVVINGTVIWAEGDHLGYSSDTTGAAFANYRFAIGSGGVQGSLSVSATYTSAQEHRIFRGSGAPYISEGKPFTVSRASLALDWNQRWSATLFVDNISNSNGRYPGVAANVTDWYARVRPRTFGLQVDMHL